MIHALLTNDLHVTGITDFDRQDCLSSQPTRSTSLVPPFSRLPDFVVIPAITNMNRHMLWTHQRPTPRSPQSQSSISCVPRKASPPLADSVFAVRREPPPPVPCEVCSRPFGVIESSLVYVFVVLIPGGRIGGWIRDTGRERSKPGFQGGRCEGSEAISLRPCRFFHVRRRHLLARYY